MGRQRKQAKALRLYVRVFKKDGRDSRIINKTYSIRDYVGYVSMMSDLRRILWSVYRKEFNRKRDDVLASYSPGSATTHARRRPGIQKTLISE